MGDLQLFTMVDAIVKLGARLGGKNVSAAVVLHRILFFKDVRKTSGAGILAGFVFLRQTAVTGFEAAGSAHRETVAADGDTADCLINGGAAVHTGEGGTRCVWRSWVSVHG